jgi:hypothetical protein
MPDRAVALGQRRGKLVVKQRGQSLDFVCRCRLGGRGSLSHSQTDSRSNKGL